MSSLAASAVMSCLSAVMSCLSAVMSCLSAVMSCLSAVMSCLSAVMSCLSAVMSCLLSVMSYISSVPWCTPLGRHCCRLGFAVIIFISQCVYFYFFYHPYSSNGCLTVYSINTFHVCCMHLSGNLLSVCLIVLT